MKILSKLLVFLLLFIFWNILLGIQFYYFKLYNLFTLNLVFFIFLIILNWYLGSKAHLSHLSIKTIVAISSIILIDLIAEFVPKDNIDLVGKNLILKEFVDTDFHSGAGYKLRDGSYYLDVEIMIDNLLVSSYKSEYTIKNSQRVMKNINTSDCVDILMIGGSHNFGQSLPDQHTLQFELNSRGYSTINISAPGYGLVNNFAILEKLKDRDHNLWQCPPKYIIYRFIRDHINRDNAKNMFSPHGAHIVKDSTTYKLKRNNSNILSKLSYFLTKYFPTRIIWYGSRKESEFSFSLISQQIEKFWFFTSEDIKRSAYFLDSLNELWGDSQKKPVIMVLIDSIIIDEIIEKYINYLKKFKDIEVILPRDQKFFSEWSEKNCSDLQYNEQYIPYEGHPTGCLNSFYSQRILNRINDR